MWELLELTALIKGKKDSSDILTTVCEESLDVESCVSCGSLFIWDKTLHHCDFLNTRTEQKHFLNQGLGSFTLFGLGYKDERRKSKDKEWWLWVSMGNMIMGAASDIWWISVSGIQLKQSHQNLIGLRLICSISAWNFNVGMDSDVSQQPCRYICWYHVFWPLDVKLLLSWNTSTSPWIFLFLNGQIKPDVFYPAAAYWADASTRTFTVKTVSVGLEKQPPTLPSLLLFLSSIRSRLPSVSPRFIYRLRNCRGGEWGRSVLKLEDSLAPVYCLKKEHTVLPFPLCFIHFAFLLFSLSLSFLKSSSAPLWAGFKDSKCEEFNPVWVNARQETPYSHSI